MKNKSVQNCQFIHHAKLHCIMTSLNRLFKTEFERGELEKSRREGYIREGWGVFNGKGLEGLFFGY